MHEKIATQRLDLKGLKCPLPALHASRALERAAPGAVITVECTDPMAVIDIPHMVRERGHTLEMQDTGGEVLVFRIRRRSQAAPSQSTGPSQHRGRASDHAQGEQHQKADDSDQGRLEQK